VYFIVLWVYFVWREFGIFASFLLFGVGIIQVFVVLFEVVGVWLWFVVFLGWEFGFLVV